MAAPLLAPIIVGWLAYAAPQVAEAWATAGAAQTDIDAAARDYAIVCPAVEAGLALLQHNKRLAQSKLLAEIAAGNAATCAKARAAPPSFLANTLAIVAGVKAWQAAGAAVAAAAPKAAGAAKAAAGAVSASWHGRQYY